MFGQLVQWFRAAADWPRQGESATDPEFVPLGDSAAYAGGTYSRANRVGVLYAIIKLLVDAVIPLPRFVYRGRELVAGHPLTPLLEQPSAEFDSWNGYEYPLRAMLTQGNGYWIVNRGRSGSPVNLTPAVEGGAYYVGDAGVGTRRYSLSPLAGAYPGGVQDLPFRDVVALHWHGFTGLSSPSPVAFAAGRQARLMQATLRLLEAQVDRARTSGAVIKHTNTESKEDRPGAKQIRETLAVLKEAYSEATEERKIPALPPGLEGGRVPGLDQADALALEILRWNVEDIARIYSVSPGRLGQMSGGGAGVRTQDYQDQVSDFAHFAAAPVARRIDAAMTLTLLSVEERMRGLRVRSDLTELSMGSPADIASLGVQLVGGGTHTPNEVRRQYHGLPDHKDGDKLSAPRGSAGPGKNKAPAGGDPK